MGGCKALQVCVLDIESIADMEDVGSSLQVTADIPSVIAEMG